MSNSSDIWLEYLVKHPIFELTNSEKQQVQSIKKNQTRQGNSVADFVLQHHVRVLTKRDNDLFVAVGSQIRVLNLIAFKDAWLSASQQPVMDENWVRLVPYKVLDTPEINFDIETISANRNGRLLSVVGSKRLVVVCIPKHGFSTMTLSQKVDCRTLSIGNKYYGESKSDIVKVEWHPLSENASHIVILGNDNILRIYNVSSDLEEPEQLFDLSPVEQKSESDGKVGGLSFIDEDSADEDAVTFTLGGTSKDQSGWEPFTVFYALRSGHVYSLCPVIPYRSIVRRNHLENLSYISEAKFEQSKQSDATEEHRTLSHLFNLHRVWINALFQSAKIARQSHISNTIDDNILTVSSDDRHSDYPVQRQGPFLINHTQALEDGIEAVDILYSNTDPVGVIVLALNNGTVHNYILSSEIDPQWQMPVHQPTQKWHKDLGILLSDADFLPKATLYETISLKSQAQPQYQSMTLVADVSYDDTYFVYHASGVHVIRMHNWLQNLRELSTKFEQGDDTKQGLNSWLKEKATSDIRMLVNSAPFSDGLVPIVGLAIFDDVYLSYCMVAITGDYQAVTKELQTCAKSSTDVSESAMKQQLKSIGDDAEEDDMYQPLLPLPAYQPPKVLESLSTQPKIVIPADLSGSKELVINEETLRFFSKSTQQIRTESHELKKAAYSIQKRMTVQQKEFERQVAALRDLYDKLQQSNSNDVKAEQQKKLDELSKRHYQLRLRVDEQVRSLVNCYQPDLSNEEKEFVSKLKQLSKQISGATGYGKRIEMLRSQLEQLKVQTTHVNKPKLTNMNPTQLKNLLRTLKEQTGTLKEVSERFEKLEDKLPTATKA